MLRGNVRLTLCVICLIATCWTARASEPEVTSEALLTAPLIGLPTVERLTQLLGSSDLYRGSDVVEWVVLDLIPLEIEPLVRTWGRQVAQKAAEEGAAAALAPVLVELAGVTAELGVMTASRNTLLGITLGTITLAVIAVVAAVAR